MDIDTVTFFDALAARMNADPERYRLLGEAYMSVGITMHRTADDFRVRLEFDGLRCDVFEGDERDVCDYRLEGPIAAWQQMFDVIAANGRAVGLQTVNSLVMFGDDIALEGRDPMGLDKFSRFNQTLQEFLDGAAGVLPVAVR